jgi:hypothetical protein
MSWRGKLLRIAAILVVILVLSGGMYRLANQALSLPFRATNDMLHHRNAPITLDFLIPAGVHIDEQMTIRAVAHHRFQKPKTHLTRMMEKLSQILPVRYRIMTTILIYIFWTFLFLIFFRIFTWMRYWTALSVAFVCGAVVYYFMPDIIMGRLDDAGALLWSGVFLTLVRYVARRRKPHKGVAQTAQSETVPTRS